MNFLAAYKALTAWPASEAPAAYHDWAAYAILSSCCGPNLWKDMGTIGNLQPNLYIMFVGPPGIRKSTAKDIAVRILAKIHTDKHPIPFAPDSCSKEAFIQFLAKEKSPCIMTYEWENKPRKYTKCSVFSDEFVNLVQVGGDPLSWIQTLTEIYNPKPVYRGSTISRGDKDIPYPYITLLGCMTPELTRSLINENALSGGFSRRTIYVYANRNFKPVPEPTETEEQREALEHLISRGRQIQSLSGRFEFSDSGKRIYRDFYEKTFYEREQAVSAAVVNFLQSKADQVIKVAMLSRLAHSDELILDQDEMELAIALVDDAQKHIDTIFAGVGKNPHASTMSGIKQFIELHCNHAPHYVTKKKIYAAFLNQASQTDIDSLLSQMVHVELIKHVMVNVGGQGLMIYTSPDFAEKLQAKVKDGS